ncbi:hypothetical protein LJR029_003314 [Caballeronia sp. LjRoot29]
MESRTIYAGADGLGRLKAPWLWPGANGRKELALGTVANISATWLPVLR